MYNSEGLTLFKFTSKILHELFPCSQGPCIVPRPLVNILSDLQHSFKLIGLSETWLNTAKDQPYNFSLPGYKFLSQPSKSELVGLVYLSIIAYLLAQMFLYINKMH